MNTSAMCSYKKVLNKEGEKTHTTEPKKKKKVETVA